MSRHSTELSVTARYAELKSLLAKIAAQAVLLRLSDTDGQRLQLIVEELFLNTITHGHGGDSANLVHIDICCNNNLITLRYQDSAPLFDISCAISHTAEENQIGGLGIGLIQGMSKAIRYQRQGSMNVTELDF